jgi:3-hydroxyisobutyrate dehydrogenase-like beta-hydroxyacid dehydrogenase
MRKVGLCGAGVMGRAAIGQLVHAGWKVAFFEVSDASRATAVQLGAVAVDFPAALNEKAEVVLLFLPGPAEVTNCVNGSKGLLSGSRKPAVIVDMSTVDPGTSRTLSQIANERGVGYLDAPVLGRPSAAGKWALPVGGESGALAKARPVLKTMAEKIFHVGSSGAGNRIKLLNQLMFGAINAMTAEMMAIASKSGVSPKLLFETITASQAGTVSNLFKELGKRITENDYDNPTFTVDLLVKDVRLAVQMADDNQAPPLLGRVIDYINAAAQSHGYGNRDTAEMWKLFENLCNSKTSS